MAIVVFEGGPLDGQRRVIETSPPSYIVVHTLAEIPARIHPDPSVPIPVSKFLYRRQSKPGERPAVYVPDRAFAQS